MKQQLQLTINFGEKPKLPTKNGANIPPNTFFKGKIRNLEARTSCAYIALYYKSKGGVISVISQSSQRIEPLWESSNGYEFDEYTPVALEITVKEI